MEAPLSPPVNITVKSSPLPIIILSILLVASLAASVFLFYQNTKLQQHIDSLSATPLTPTPSPYETSQDQILDSATAGWETYTSEEYSFKYPSNIFTYINTHNGQLYLATQEGPGESKGTPIGLSKEDIWISITIAPASGSQTNQPKRYVESTVSQEVYSYTTTLVRNQKAIRIDASSFSANTIQAFEPNYDKILSTFKFLPDEASLLSCSNDADCALNSCNCTAQNAYTIPTAQKACTRVCHGTPTCINQQCQLVQ